MKGIKKINLVKFLGVFFIYSGIGASFAAFVLNKYWSDNQAPIPVIIHSNTEGSLPGTIKFDASNSTDPDGDNIRYSWMINGERVSSQSNIEYEFKEAGNYHVTLDVEDKHGLKSRKTIFIDVKPPKSVSSVNNALKYFKYEIGWKTERRKEIKFHPIDVVHFPNKNSVTLYKQNMFEFHGAILGLKRKIFGIWTEGEIGIGEFSLDFNEDFTEATGWWCYDYDDNKYDLRLQRVQTDYY